LTTMQVINICIVTLTLARPQYRILVRL